jgi:hypothetical protein
MTANRCAPAEIERTEIKLLDKHVNYTNRIVLVDPIIQAIGKQCRLPAIHSLDEALHRDLPPKIASQFYHAGRFHTAWTQSGRSGRAMASGAIAAIRTLDATTEHRIDARCRGLRDTAPRWASAAPPAAAGDFASVGYPAKRRPYLFINLY